MSFIYVPFSYVMKFCVWISQNSYFFGLFFFALAFEIILLPLAIKQKKSQIATARVRPKEYAIRKKYAGRTDRVTQQKMQQEIMELQQKENVSPLGGCMPLIVQLHGAGERGNDNHYRTSKRVRTRSSIHKTWLKTWSF